MGNLRLKYRYWRLVFCRETRIVSFGFAQIFGGPNYVQYSKIYNDNFSLRGTEEYDWGFYRREKQYLVEFENYYQQYIAIDCIEPVRFVEFWINGIVKGPILIQGSGDGVIWEYIDLIPYSFILSNGLCDTRIDGFSERIAIPYRRTYAHSFGKYWIVCLAASSYSFGELESSFPNTKYNLSELEMYSTIGGANVCTGGVPYEGFKQFNNIAPDYSYYDVGLLFDNIVDTPADDHFNIIYDTFTIGYLFSSPISIAQIGIGGGSSRNSLTHATQVPVQFFVKTSLDGMHWGVVKYIEADRTLWPDTGTSALVKFTL